jgi:hypothetical protein
MTKNNYLSKHKREKNVRFIFTERDFDILKAVNNCRYLRASQIKRVVFPENKDLQATRRRLKYLFHNGYLDRLEPIMPRGTGSGEIAYFLDRKGAELLESEGEKIYSYAQNNKVKHQFLNHALDLSEFWINISLSLKDHPHVFLHRFTFDYELKTYAQKETGRKIYKLFDEVIHPVNRKRYVVYPDALIILKGKGEYHNFQRLYFLEIDRGTERLDIVRDKVIGYNIYKRENLFKKYGNFEDFKVLIQTNSEKRAQNMRNHFLNLEGSDFTWISNVRKVDQNTVLHAPIWTDHKFEPRQILKS